MTSIAQSLAVDGGPPVRSQPLPRWPYFDQEQVDAAAAVLSEGRINYWTGTEGREFEAEFAEYIGVEHAITVANGTVALEMVMRALGLGPGDDVVVSPRTFIASAACAVSVGARPVFADVDVESQLTTASTIEAALTPQTKAIIVVHLAGWPAEMDAITQLAAARNIAVIEDCAQAHGASIDGRRVGSFGVAATFSFCQDKIMTTGGEGGMIVTSDAGLHDDMWSFRDHGKDRKAVEAPNPAGGFRWVHHSFGTNARMTEMQSALGRIQLRRLPGWLDARRANAEALDRILGEIEALRVTVPPDGIDHAYYKYYTFVRPERLEPGWDRDRIMAALSAEGIPSFSGSCPELYLERAFDSLDRPEQRLPVARELGETSLMLMVHPTLQDGDIHDVGTAVAKVVQAATG